MGSHISRLFSDCIVWPFGMTKPAGPIHLPEDEETKREDSTPKRRALLVGISYSGPFNTWSRLDGPHGDVDHFRELLVGSYGYHPEDIVVLKDSPNFPDTSQPTRLNMLRELRALVFGAVPGDSFTFLYSGHSDQQPIVNDFDEEDGQDEMLIPSDEQPIIDNAPFPDTCFFMELREILIPLPVGCSLFAVLDTCHSGTLLDLPHHHCNNVYVPWQSKGTRRTMTMQNNNVRAQAMDFANSTSQRRPLIDSVIDGSQLADQPSRSLFQTNAQVGEGRSSGQRELSPGPQPRGRGTRRPRERMLFTSQVRYASPESRLICDGCFLSLSACSDFQQAWEGPKGSLTTVVCNYLKTQKQPSYRALMSHINFQLYDNSLALHEYTRYQKRKAARGEGDGFEGDLDNFQVPELSSLVKLNMDDTLQL
ncbi:caspase domain-containing protein [Multifurca ochricompacta]|uniref:Caspase domain-containing protein n=1 Tax=Multifurca ochricompacta TaxID=376703 RepID=A0AAD4QK81_9AGAM|nr:caspase domain-containing protein [Multifurca ochricompacta]